MAKEREQRYASAGELARAAARPLEAARTVARSAPTPTAAPAPTAVLPQTPAPASPVAPSAAAAPHAPAPPSRRGLWIAVAAAATLVATAVVLLAAGVFGGGGGGGGGSDLPTPGVYKGQTSAGGQIELTVADGEVRDIKSDGASQCKNQQTGASAVVPYRFVALPTTRGSIQDGGHFDIEVRLDEQTFRMQGDFKGTTAQGNLSWQYRADENGQGPLATGPVQCDTGPIGWNVSGG